MSKKLFLVLGPESSGNHVTSLVLKNMGCFWDEPQELDRFLLGEIKLSQVTSNSNIVLRRSVPHGRDWPVASDISKRFAEEGYEMSTIVLQREWMATILSNYYHRSTNVQEAWDTLVKGEKHISNQMFNGDLDPFYILNTSALMKDPEAVIIGLEIFTGLEWPKDVRYEKAVHDSDIGRHNLLLDTGFESIDRSIHQKYIKRIRPLVIR